MEIRATPLFSRWQWVILLEMLLYEEIDILEYRERYSANEHCDVPLDKKLVSCANILFQYLIIMLVFSYNI